MRSRWIAALGAVVLVTAPGCATVQVRRPDGPVPLEPGKRVRVTLSNRFAPAPLIGTVASVTPDTLAVERGDELHALSREQVEKVEVSLGKVREPDRAAGEAILAGTPLLIPLGVLLLFAGFELGDEGGAVPTVLVFAGAIVGGLALVGAAIGGGPQDVWVPAAWPPAEGP